MNSLASSEPIPQRGNGDPPRRSTRAAKTHFWALLRTAFVSVQPVKTSVTVRVWGELPMWVPALVADQVDLHEPRRLLIAAAQVRIEIEDFNRDPGLAAERPSTPEACAPQPAGARSWPPTCRTASPRSRRQGPAPQGPQPGHHLR
jgi:hypothetical protein